ncbi:hypothetical protein NDU88_003760 [Pleurodeles waltl]|uniref:Uncharacterized protein n=1 Tax=Pleurodeles waltl TaxID=8319 RepID=A0AAV7NHJ6_PLEWA|nr:hypothetical protein NDU88_003760 [Pleurodeles waltl]
MWAGGPIPTRQCGPRVTGLSNGPAQSSPFAGSASVSDRSPRLTTELRSAQEESRRGSGAAMLFPGPSGRAP